MERSPNQSAPQQESREAVKDSSTATGTSDQGSSVTASDLLSIIPEEALNSNSVGMIRLLPEILTLLEDLTGDELFVVLEELNELSKDKSQAESGKAEAIVGLLFIVLSDVEPERILVLLEEEDQDDQSLHSIQSSALLSLARQDPVKAEAYLKASDWRGPLRRSGELAVFGGWMESDFERAVQYLEKTGLDSGREISLFANAGRSSEVRSEMKMTLEKLEDSSLKKNLTTGLMGAEYTAAGFDGVSQLLAGMTFTTPKARDEAISGAANMGLASKPGETIEWLKKEASPARRGEFLWNSVASWARQDYQAAGEWLKVQEPSSDTDHAIFAYASMVAQINPEAAMTWTDEIQAGEVQQQARKRSLREWHKTNPEAARNWVVEQGWEAEDWLPKSD